MIIARRKISVGKKLRTLGNGMSTFNDRGLHNGFKSIMNSQVFTFQKKNQFKYGLFFEPQTQNNLYAKSELSEVIKEWKSCIQHELCIQILGKHNYSKKECSLKGDCTQLWSATKHFNLVRVKSRHVRFPFSHFLHLINPSVLHNICMTL